jgi:hypothetical protein
VEISGDPAEIVVEVLVQLEDCVVGGGCRAGDLVLGL